MKITMVILNTLSVRFDARVRKEMQSLADDGHQVALVGIAQEGEQLRGMGGGRLLLFPLWTRARFRHPLSWPVKFVEYFVRALWASMRTGADAYHAHDLDALPVALVAGWLRGVPVVYDAHELFGERLIAMAAMWRWLDRQLVNRADLVIAANEERADVMVAEYGARERPVVLMNTPRSGGARADARLRAVLRLERESSMVVYQGALAPGRGIETIIASMSAWPSSAVFVLVGNAGAYVRALVAELPAKYGVEGRVLLADPVPSDAVADYISEADVGLVLYENTCRNNFLCAPNKLFEYCAAGVPVVASGFPPIANLMREFPVGLPVDPDKPGQLAAAVIRLLTDRSLAARARAACGQAIALYNWEVERLKLRAAYERIEALRGERSTGADA